MDLSILKTVNQPTAVTPEDYTAPVDYSEALPKGEYVVRVIDGRFKDKATNSEDPFRLGTTKKGDLQVEVALEITEGAKGKRLYDRVNTAAFQNGKGNTFFNFLMALGNKASLASSEDYIRALDRAIKSGASTRVFVDREWYCNPNSRDFNGCGTSTKGDNGHLRIQCPNTTVHGDDAPTLLARNTLSKYRAVS
jgi:hypothetical protein